MWPAMTAEPMEPGRGLPVYQPATVADDGTCSVPPSARPSLVSAVFTPITGMVSETGLATGTGPAAVTGRADPDGPAGGATTGPAESATTGPAGAGTVATPAGGGRMAGVDCLVSVSYTHLTLPTIYSV